MSTIFSTVLDIVFIVLIDVAATAVVVVSRKVFSLGGCHLVVQSFFFGIGAILRASLFWRGLSQFLH